MTHHPQSKSTHAHVSAGVDPELLRAAQAYLASLRRHEPPGVDAREAWTKFYRVCHPLLRRFALACHIRPAELDDCVQAAWKDITVALPTFHDDGQLRRFHTWLRVIVHSKATD